MHPTQPRRPSHRRSARFRPTPTFDVGGLSGSTSATLVVFQQAATVAGLTLSQGTVNVGGTTTLSGTIVDPDPVVSHTVTIQWGDTPAATSSGTSSWRPDVFKRTHVREHARQLALGHVADRRDGRQQRPSFGRRRTTGRHRRRRLAGGADREPASFDHRLARLPDLQRIRAAGTLNQLSYQWTLTTGMATSTRRGPARPFPLPRSAAECSPRRWSSQTRTARPGRPAPGRRRPVNAE